MSTQFSHFNAVVIGGGPAGSTLATFLARAGKSVALIEAENFPRFHIGESLLPASTPIFERLGILDEMKKQFIHKPGGKWLVENGEWLGDFQNCEDNSTFSHCRYSYMVERSKFDHLLLKNAEKNGVQLIQPARVTDFVYNGDRMSGVVTETQEGIIRSLSSDMIFDCSGRKAVIARRLQLVRSTAIRRIALFAHFEAEAKDPHLKQGWFVGEMIKDGWVWLIPLEEKKISIGIVINLSELKNAQKNPEQFFMDQIEATELYKKGLTSERRRTSEVFATDHMGYTTQKAHGEGWVAVGDAAFFVDPCFSSGVHLAMHSGELAAKAFLSNHEKGKPMAPEVFDAYENTLRSHEKYVSMMVRVYYNCSNSSELQKHSISRLNLANDKKFATFVGGDFSSNTDFIASAFNFTEEFLNEPAAQNR